MKKTYQKPEIMFEDFTLSVNIAGDCTVKTMTPSENSCAYPVKAGFATWNVFTAALDICTVKDDVSDKIQDGIFDSICYHVPYESSSLFNS